DVAFERQREQEAGERIIVGVNEYQVEETAEKDIEEVSEEVEAAQQESVQSVRADRDEDAVEAALATVRETARSDENLMPALIEAVKVYATTGEICDAMRDVFGEYQGGGI
ncbi:MAG: methylmalonyl-CoA mutase family protein, partial [Halorientalis sp.]